MGIAESLKHVSLFSDLDDAARESIAQLALTDTAGRLARHLTDLARRKGVALEKGANVRLDLPKGELARLLGTAPETLSRALARLAEADVLAVDGKVITFRNPDVLQTLSRGRFREES